MYTMKYVAVSNETDEVCNKKTKLPTNSSERPTKPMKCATKLTPAVRQTQSIFQMTRNSIIL